MGAHNTAPLLPQVRHGCMGTQGKRREAGRCMQKNQMTEERRGVFISMNACLRKKQRWQEDYKAYVATLEKTQLAHMTKER